MEKKINKQSPSIINSEHEWRKTQAYKWQWISGMAVFAAAVSVAFCLAYAQNNAENAQSDNIHVSQVRTYSEHELLYLDLTANITLPVPVKEALNNGIRLSFLTEIEIYSPKRLLLNKRLAYFGIIKKLSFHALTKKFILHDPRKNTNQNFDSLEDALHHLGLYRGVPLTSTLLSKSSPDTMMRVRIRLLQDQLPWLLYLKSRLPPWKLSSDWYAWDLN